MECEVDSDYSFTELMRLGGTFESNGVRLQIAPAEEGHGFGLTEVVTIAVTVATNVSSAVIADAVLEATKDRIRRVRAKGKQSDGSKSGVESVVDAVRQEGSDAAGDLR